MGFALLRPVRIWQPLLTAPPTPPYVPPPPPDLRAGLYAALIACPAVIATAATRVFPLKPPETNATGAPTLLYQVDGVDRHETVDGPTGNATAVLRFGAGSANYLDTVALSAATRSLLDGFTGELGGQVYCQGCTFKLGTETEEYVPPIDDSDRGMYWTTFEFTLLYRER